LQNEPLKRLKSNDSIYCVVGSVNQEEQKGQILGANADREDMAKIGTTRGEWSTARQLSAKEPMSSDCRVATMQTM